MQPGSAVLACRDTRQLELIELKYLHLIYRREETQFHRPGHIHPILLLDLSIAGEYRAGDILKMLIVSLLHLRFGMEYQARRNRPNLFSGAKTQQRRELIDLQDL